MPVRKSRTVRNSAPPPRGWFFPRVRQWVRGLRWYWRWPLTAGLWLGAMGVLVLLVGNLVYSSLSRRYDLNDLGRMPERSVVYDAAGNELGRLHGENRTVVPLSEVSPWFVEALLAREDDRFYSHGGVDYIGVLRAIFRAVKDRDVQQGASTITMQLARNSYDLTREKSLHRKLLEISITRRIESSRNKDQILELYVNRIFFGSGIYGIERAAQGYFGKRAKDLTLDESAMLAAIIRGPNAFSPYRHYDIAVSGRNMVLDRMVVKERLSKEQAEQAKSVITRVLPEPKPPQDSWSLDAVRRNLERLLDAGEVEEGGLRIYTTLDPALQKAAEEELAAELARVERLPGYRHQTLAQYEDLVRRGLATEPEYLQGAVVTLENATGAVRAIVGGRDIRHSSYNRAILARRQAGSTFKPFVYAAAVEEAGLFPGLALSDDPLQPGEIISAEDNGFRPVNSDGTFLGRQPAWLGLAKSRNTMAVRAGERAGLDTVKALAYQAGLGKIEGNSPQIYLGNVPAALEDLTSAMSLFPNEGVRCRPYIIDRIEDADGALVYRSGVMAYPVVSPGTAWTMCQMLRRVMEPGGTAAGAGGFRALCGGKTGTTDDYHDAWFAGFSTQLTCGVWVGLDDPARIIHQGYGSRLALPIWAGVMKAAAADWPPGTAWPDPGPVQTVKLCVLSGRLAGDGCGRFAVNADIPEDRMPDGYCPLHDGAAAGLTGRKAEERTPRTSSPSVIDRLRGLFR